MYLLEWPKLERQITPSGGKDVEELELSHTAAGNVKWYKAQPLEKTGAVSLKVRLTHSK